VPTRAARFSPGQPTDSIGAFPILENWQSEFLQLLAFVVLTAFLIHRGSHESRDGADELKAMLTDMDQRLARIEQALSPSRHTAAAGDRP
jgi:hypothetical protein